MDGIKTVIVTGGAGYLGAKICLHLKNQGYDVIAFCRSYPTDVKKLEGIKIICGDITDASTYDTLFPEHLRAIIHTVSLDHKRSEEATIEEVDKVNVRSLWQLLEWSKKKNIAKFIYLSTIQVLGKLPEDVILENHPKAPGNVYGLTHSMSEDLVTFYHHQSTGSYINLRLSNGYGTPVFENNNCWWLVINDLCRSACKDQKIVLNSDGSSLRDFIHVNDIARAVEMVISKDELPAKLYHVSSGKTHSLLEIAHMISEVKESKYGVSVPVYYSGTILSAVKPKKKDFYTVDNTRLLNIGYQPAVSLQEGIGDLLNYLKKKEDESGG